MNIEERLTQIEERLTNLEKLCVVKPDTAKSRTTDDLEALILANIDKIGQQDLAVLGLKIRPKQTKSQIKTMFHELGKATGNWFEGSNFTRLLKKGIIKEDGVDEKNVTLYSLSKSGDKVTAQKIIDKLKQEK